jgi:Leucine-rich repeat (LRR) protein
MAGPAGCGSGCPTRLSFNDLGLTSIDAGAFGTTGLQHVTSLDLSINQLTNLPSGTFDKLTGLVSLTLHGNQLTSLPAGTFDKLTGLVTLSLEGNQLTSLPAGIFDILSSLTTLRLPSASQFECFVSLPSSVMVYTSPGVGAEKTAYDELARCGE